MSVEGCSQEVCSSIPDTVVSEGDHSFVEKAMKVHQTMNPVIQSSKRFFRDRFYLPLNQTTSDPFFIDSGRYSQQFVAMLKGENPNLDGTFPQLPELIKHFSIRDIPVELKVGDSVIVFQTRVIESKESIEGKKLRLILFSFADHKVKMGDGVHPWDPMHIDELSGSILDILKAYQSHTHIDSMFCFSLGSLFYDGLKHVKPEESDFIPKVLGLNRGLASIKKVSEQLYPYPISSILYNSVYYLGLDANPERELLQFFQRMQFHGAPMNHREVVVIEARHDRYFSGAGKFDENFCSDLKDAGASVSHGNFFVPMVAEAAHHAIRLDWIVNNQDAGTNTERFLPFPKNKTLAEGLAKNILMQTEKDGVHTCFLVGGNKDNLDSVTYLQAAPLLVAYLKEVQDRAKRG